MQVSSNYKLKMHQPLDEMFYQTINYRAWDKDTKVMANRLSTTMKNPDILLLLLV